MTKYAVAMGSNLGDRIGILRTAVASMRDMGAVTAIGGLYETVPIGGPKQDPYLNSLVVLESPEAPELLLPRLQELESDAGRKRTVRWGPRTLDLDIVASDGGLVSTADLRIPHPLASERRFVLQPLVDVWPDADVGDGRTASAALEDVLDQEAERLSRHWADPAGLQPGRYWIAVQFVLFLAIAVAMAMDGSLPGDDPEVTRVIGGFLVVAGGLLAFMSVKRLGRSLTAVPEPLEEATLVVSGVYSLVRHPSYGGVFIFMFGTTLILDSIWGVAISIGLLRFFWKKSEYEERQLRIAYPDYSSYRRRVQRRLIPFLL